MRQGRPPHFNIILSIPNTDGEASCRLSIPGAIRAELGWSATDRVTVEQAPDVWILRRSERGLAQIFANTPRHRFSSPARFNAATANQAAQIVTPRLRLEEPAIRRHECEHLVLGDELVVQMPLGVYPA